MYALKSSFNQISLCCCFWEQEAAALIKHIGRQLPLIQPHAAGEGARTSAEGRRSEDVGSRADALGSRSGNGGSLRSQDWLPSLLESPLISRRKQHSEAGGKVSNRSSSREGSGSGAMAAALALVRLPPTLDALRRASGSDSAHFSSLAPGRLADETGFRTNEGLMSMALARLSNSGAGPTGVKTSLDLTAQRMGGSRRRTNSMGPEEQEVVLRDGLSARKGGGGAGGGRGALAELLSNSRSLLNRGGGGGPKSIGGSSIRQSKQKAMSGLTVPSRKIQSERTGEESGNDGEEEGLEYDAMLAIATMTTGNNGGNSGGERRASDSREGEAEEVAGRRTASFGEAVGGGRIGGGSRGSSGASESAVSIVRRSEGSQTSRTVAAAVRAAIRLPSSTTSVTALAAELTVTTRSTDASQIRQAAAYAQMAMLRNLLTASPAVPPAAVLHNGRSSEGG